MSTQSFYLVGDASSAAREIIVNEKDDTKSLKKTLTKVYHVAGKQGKLFGKFETEFVP